MHELVRKDEGPLRNGDSKGDLCEVPVAVVEQRASNLVQGSLCLVLLTRPFLNVLNLVPQGAPRYPYYTLLKVCLHPHVSGVLAGLLYVSLLLALRPMI